MEEKNKEELIKENGEENKQTEDPRLKNHSFIDAWKNAFKGIFYAVNTQGNLRKQLIIAVIIVIASLFFNLTRAEFLCFLFTIILVIFAEMVNTAIETVVDLYVDVYHPKAKIAKDVAAGGVVITSINAFIVFYVLFFDKISDVGLNFIENVTNNPVHLAFTIMIIVVISILALITYFMGEKNKIKYKKFIPSGHATIAFAANTLIWLLTDNIVILMLSLIMSLLVSESRIAAKEHKLSEIIFSGCFGTVMVLILFGILKAVLKII